MGDVFLRDVVADQRPPPLWKTTDVDAIPFVATTPETWFPSVANSPAPAPQPCATVRRPGVPPIAVRVRLFDHPYGAGIALDATAANTTIENCIFGTDPYGSGGLSNDINIQGSAANVHIRDNFFYSTTMTGTDPNNNTYGTTPPGPPHPRYVSAVYQDVLSRPPDAAGLAYWSGQLDNGAPRGDVAALLVHSDEYYGNIIITPAYSRFLGRGPDAAGIAYWVDQTNEDLITGFVAADEYYKNHTR